MPWGGLLLLHPSPHCKYANVLNNNYFVKLICVTLMKRRTQKNVFLYFWKRKLINPRFESWEQGGSPPITPPPSTPIRVGRKSGKLNFTLVNKYVTDSWGAKIFPVRDQEWAAEGAITILPKRSEISGEGKIFFILPKIQHLEDFILYNNSAQYFHYLSLLN